MGRGKGKKGVGARQPGRRKGTDPEYAKHQLKLAEKKRKQAEKERKNAEKKARIEADTEYVKKVHRPRKRKGKKTPATATPLAFRPKGTEEEVQENQRQLGSETKSEPELEADWKKGWKKGDDLKTVEEADEGVEDEDGDLEMVSEWEDEDEDGEDDNLGGGLAFRPRV